MFNSIASRSQNLVPKLNISESATRILLTALLVAVAYYLGALFSFALRVPSTRSSIIWAPNAVLLAALVVTPPRTWWVWLVAALPAHLLAQSRDAAPLLLLICPFLANIGQAVLAAIGLRRFMDVPYRLESLREMTVFILVAVLAAPALVSLTAAWLFVAAGWETDYWLAAEARLLNNILTGLTVAPLCLAIAGGDLVKLRRLELRRYVEFGILLIALVGTMSIAFAWEATETIKFPIRLYAPLPFLFWAAVRFRPAAVSIALLMIAYDSISDSIAGHGIFATGSGVANVLAVEASLGVLALPLMLLAALMQERMRKEDALRESEARYRALVTASSEVVWRANSMAKGSSLHPRGESLPVKAKKSPGTQAGSTRCTPRIGKDAAGCGIRPGLSAMPTKTSCASALWMEVTATSMFTWCRFYRRMAARASGSEQRRTLPTVSEPNIYYAKAKRDSATWRIMRRS